MFSAMMDAIKEESVGFLFNVEVQVEEQQAPELGDLIASGPGEVQGEVMSEHLLAEPGEGESSDPAAPAVDLAKPADAAPAADPSERDQAADPELSASAVEVALGLEAGGLPLPPTAPQPVEGPASPSQTRAVLPEIFGRQGRPSTLSYSAPDEQGAAAKSGPPVVDPLTGQVTSDGPSRNAACPCGSGRKYKRCHGAPGGAS